MSRDALVVGINFYPFLKDVQTRQPKHLRTPTEDATAIAQVLENHGDFLTQKLIVPYSNSTEEGTITLPNPEDLVNVEDLETAIKRLFIPNSNTPAKTALLFFSGHGLRKKKHDEELTQGYLATCEVDGNRRLGVSLSWLCEILEKSPVRQQIILLDCCYSGELINTWQSWQFKKNNNKQTRFFITASRDFEVAYNSPTGKYGALTEFLLEKLNPEKHPEDIVTNHTFINLINQGLHILSQRPLVFPETVESGKIYLTCGKNNKFLLSSETREDWGTATDLNAFFGRTKELKDLSQWIIEERCKLVIIVGMGGVGKTSLSVKLGKGGIGKTDFSLKLAQNIKDEFDYVLWRSLFNAPKFSLLITDIIQFLSNQKETELPENLNEQISKLLHYLRSSRCLLLLDNIDKVLSVNKDIIQYEEGYEGYGELFKQIGDTKHQSCLIVTSREVPKDIELLIGDQLPVRKLELEGLDYSAGREIFMARGSFSGSDGEWKQIIDYYNGNPLALELAANYIKKECNCSISVFLQKKDKPIFDKLHNLLDWHFERLSISEKQISYWLAINREPVSSEELKKDILSRKDRKKLSSALFSLQEKFPIEIRQEKEDREYSLQPVLVDYLTERLVEKAVYEIKNEEIEILNSHSLLKALIQDYVRESQVKFILKQIWEELEYELGNKASIEKQLNKIISLLREGLFPKRGYAAGNILNLLCQNKSKLRGYDFSELNIYQAYLQGISLEEVNFAYSNIEKSALIDKLGNIFSIAFSRDGTLLAAGEANGEVLVWRAADTQTIATFRGHTDWIRSITFSPDDKILASGSEDKTIKLWDIKTEQCLKTLHGHTNWVRSVAFCPDGKTLVSGSADKTIKFWDVNTGECLNTWYGHTELIELVALNPDGQMVVSCSDDKTIRLWDINAGKCINTLQGHTNFVRSAIFSPNGQMVASCSDDKTIRLWDINTGKCTNTLQGHTNFVRSAIFSPNGQIVVSCSDDKTIRLWDINTGKCTNTLQGHKSRIWGVTFKSDSNIVASGSADQTVKLWDIHTGICLNTLQGYTNWFWSAVFSPDGQTIAGSSEDKLIRLWNVTTKECIQIFQEHESWIRSIEFSPDGKTLVSGSDDKSIKLWDVSTGKCFKTFRGHQHWIRRVTVSPDGQTIASCSDDKSIKLWDVSTGECLKTLEGHANLVQSLAFSPNGQMMASGSTDKTIKLWKVSTGECLKTLEGHANFVRSIVFTPDSKTIVSGSADKTIKLWDVATGDEKHTLSGHNDWVWSVAISPDGKTIASGSSDYTIKLWNATSGECLNTLTQHTNRIRSIAFNPQGGTLCSSSQDETVRVWNVQTGECTEILRAKRPYEGINITGVTGLTEAQKETLIALGAITN